MEPTEFIKINQVKGEIKDENRGGSQLQSPELQIEASAPVDVAASLSLIPFEAAITLAACSNVNAPPRPAAWLDSSVPRPDCCTFIVPPLCGRCVQRPAGADKR